MLEHGRSIFIHAEPQRDGESSSIYCSVMLDCPEVGRGDGGRGGKLKRRDFWESFFYIYIIFFNYFFPWVRQSGGLVLDPTNGLHLVGVSLGAVLIVVSVLALVSVSLQDVLVATVTRELIGHPAAGGKWKKKTKKTGGVKLAQTEGCKQELKLIPVSHSAERIREC